MSDINVLQSKEEGLEDLEAFSGCYPEPSVFAKWKELSSKKKKKGIPLKKDLLPLYVSMIGHMTGHVTSHMTDHVTGHMHHTTVHIIAYQVSAVLAVCLCVLRQSFSSFYLFSPFCK